MDRLFAPWRMSYVSADAANTGAESGNVSKGCIFCDKPRQSHDASNLLIYRGTTAFVMLNLYPYNNGHMMVAPYRHTSQLQELSAETLLEIMQLVQASEAALRRAYNPHGYNIGMNLGQIAGAGIADHLHLHIVPRWSGDTNFMPVLGNTKVLPDSLDGSYWKISAAWAETFQG